MQKTVDGSLARPLRRLYLVTHLPVTVSLPNDAVPMLSIHDNGRDLPYALLLVHHGGDDQPSQLQRHTVPLRQGAEHGL